MGRDRDARDSENTLIARDSRRSTGRAEVCKPAIRRFDSGRRLSRQIQSAERDDAADRSRFSPRLFRRAGEGARAGFGRLDELPNAAACLQRLKYADVVLSRRDATWPALVLEVEVCGGITAALARSAQILAQLRARGAHPLPRFIVIADTCRRHEFSAKLSTTLYTGRHGLAARCSFWSMQEVWAAYRRRK